MFFKLANENNKNNSIIYSKWVTNLIFLLNLRLYLKQSYIFNFEKSSRNFVIDLNS